MHLVQIAWEALNHSSVADKGYKQTGPNMSMTGPTGHDEVYENLFQVLIRLETGPSATVLALHLREEAIEFVNQGLPNETPGNPGT